uniref:Uncharacterized protein n=1 Tax=Catharus ustulatus TaxID=91951 RepID=A0A8C3V0G9_CATUS
SGDAGAATAALGNLASVSPPAQGQGHRPPSSQPGWGHSRGLVGSSCPLAKAERPKIERLHRAWLCASVSVGRRKDKPRPSLPSSDLQPGLLRVRNSSTLKTHCWNKIHVVSSSCFLRAPDCKGHGYAGLFCSLSWTLAFHPNQLAGTTCGERAQETARIWF